MIRAALVGVSGYGRWHLLMAMEQMLLGRLKLIGVTVINAKEQAALCRRLERQGVKIFATFEQMMEAVHVAAVMQAGITLVHSVQMQNHLKKLVL